MQALIHVFRWVLLATVPSCVLIALILLVKKAFDRRVSASFHYGIWFLLIVRLLIPFAPQSPTSALNLITPFTSAVQSSGASGIGTGNSLSNSVSAKMKTAGIQPSPAKPEKATIAEDAAASGSTPLESLLAAVWLAGVLSSLIYMLTLNRRFLAGLKDALPVEDARTRELTEQCKALLHISADIPVSYTSLVGTPSLYGVLHPRLLIPERLAGKLSDPELKYVLLHELAHYKRKDIPVIWVTSVVKSLYWFNPLVWYAFYRMRLDCENACDAFVMTHVGSEEQNGYGHLLLRLLEINAMPKAAPNGAAMVSKINKMQLKRRITMIANFKNSTPRRILLSVALAALIGITGMTGAQQASAQAAEVNPIPALRQSTVMPTTAADAASYWAETLAQRDGAARFAILSDDLKQKEWPTYRENYCTIGGSSPWVVGYTVSAEGASDSGTDCRIDYRFTDSTRMIYTGSETVTVKQFGQNWFVVRHKDVDYYGFPELTETTEKLKDGQYPPVPRILPSRTAQGTAEWWAEGFRQRSSAYRMASLGIDLQHPIFEKPNSRYDQGWGWDISASGPKVDGYTVEAISQSADNAQFRINYQLTDAAGKSFRRSETVTLKRDGHRGNTWGIAKYGSLNVG